MIAALRCMPDAMAMLLAARASRSSVDMNGFNALVCAQESLARRPQGAAKFATVVGLLTEAAVGPGAFNGDQGQARIRKLSRHPRKRENKWKSRVQVATPEYSD